MRQVIIPCAFAVLAIGVTLLIPVKGLSTTSTNAGGRIDAVATKIKASPNLTECVNDCMWDAPPVPPDNPAVTFCGTDGNTYTTSTTSLFCFDTNCNVTVLHAGSCGCPNNCSSGLHGACSADGSSCVCHAGWGGEDCNLVVCPGNTCSGHGTCGLFPEAARKDFPEGYCKCEEGWTGIDCSSRTLAVSDLPWGCVIPSVFAKGGSCQPHDLENTPWLKFSELPRIHVVLPVAEYKAMISPFNRTQTMYYNASATYVSNSDVMYWPSVGFRLHGAAARANPKKGYTIKFDEFVAAQGKWKKVFLKNAYGPIGGQLLTTMLMTTGTPVQRSSYTLFYINGHFAGLYTALEDFSKSFLRAWYDTDKGNFYKMDSGCWFQWKQDAVHTGRSHCADQREGNGNTSDYVELVRFLRFSNETYFESQIESTFDMESIIRMEVVTSFLQLLDGFTDNGNNYQCYHLPAIAPSTPAPIPIASLAPAKGEGVRARAREAGEGGKWSCFVRDFDSVFALTWIRDIFMWPIYSELKNINDPNQQNVLLTRSFPMSSINTTYVNHYKRVLKALFDPYSGSGSSSSSSSSSGSNAYIPPREWYLEIERFLRPWVHLDAQGHLFLYRGSNFTALAMQDADFLHFRYEYVWRQLVGEDF